MINRERRYFALQSGFDCFDVVTCDPGKDALTPYLEHLREKIGKATKLDEAIIVLKGKRVAGYIFDEENGTQLFITNTFALTLIDNTVQDTIPFIYFFSHPNYGEGKNGHANL